MAVNLEEHIAAGGTHELETREDGAVRCGCGTWAPPFVFMDARDRDDVAGDWRCDGCWSVELRAVQAFARAMRPEVLSNDPWTRTEQLMVWRDIPDWRTARRREYRRIDALLAEAQADLAAGNPETMARYRAEREAIKARFPKPAREVEVNGTPWPTEPVDPADDVSLPGWVRAMHRERKRRK